MTDLKKFPNAARPIWTNQGRSEGMADSDFLRGAQWKAWDGALAVSFLAGRRVDILRLDANGAVTGSSSILGNEGQRIRALVQGPDGAMYVTTDRRSGGDQIWRLVPR
jgi:aldose sugar dehydrogenase